MRFASRGRARGRAVPLAIGALVASLLTSVGGTGPVGANPVLSAQDTIPPTATAPAASLRAGIALSGTGQRVNVAWTGADNAGGSGIARYELSRSINGGTWTTIATSPASPTTALTLASKGRVQFRVRAVDQAGNVGAWAYGPGLAPSLVQQGTTAISYHGTWTKVSGSPYSGGSVRYARARGAHATYRFTARSVALVTTMGRTRGKVKIYVDGRYFKTVDTYSRITRYRVQVWSTTWTASGTHTLKLVVTGTAGRPRVDLDAVALLRAGAPIPIPTPTSTPRPTPTSTPAPTIDGEGPALSGVAVNPGMIWFGEAGCGPSSTTVSVSATDPSGVARVTLYFAPPGQAAQSKPMTEVSRGQWSATITAGGSWVRGHVDYWMEATDTPGNPSSIHPQSAALLLFAESCDEMGPTIANVRSSVDYICVGEVDTTSFSISAAVTDPSDVSSVMLVYRPPLAALWVQSPMDPISSSTWRKTITTDESWSADTSFDYSIKATDRAGHTAWYPLSGWLSIPVRWCIG